MARIRTIKPGFFRSDDVTPLSYRARLTWVGLWTYVDDDGRGKDNARIIKGEIWTLEDDITHVEVEEDLEELHRHDRISRYEVDGKRYLVINKWGDHQVISRPTPSKLPEPTEENMLPHAELTESSVSDPDVDTAGRGRGKGSGRGSGTGEEELELALIEPDIKPNLPALFDDAYEHWPKKVKRDEAYDRYVQACKKRDPYQLCEDIKRFGQAYEDTIDKQFIPALGPWLYQKRWSDELPQRQMSRMEPPRQTAAAKNMGTVAHFEQQEQLGIES